MRKLKYGITGANGFVGSHIARYLRNKKYEVYEIGRHPSKDILGEKYFIPFSLGQDIDQKKLHGIDVLVHCAYDFSLIKWKDIQRVNLNGSIKLLKKAKDAEVKKII